MHQPKVTVFMPVYNGEKYLAEGIRSILDQSFEDFELLIINDGSTDKSMDIVNSFADPRIRILENEKNLGLVKTRNKGLWAAHGENIAMLDCDDIALPDRLLLQTNFLNKNPEVGCVASQIIIINEKGKKVEVVKYKEKPENIPAIFLFNNYVAQSSVMVRSDLIKNLGYREEYPPAEDYDLWVRLVQRSKLIILQKPLIQYRLHTENISKKKAQEAAEAEIKIWQNQLACLQIYPTPDELYIHKNIAKYKFLNDKVFIIGCANWLLKLYQANLSAKIYPVKIFEEVLVHRFILICGNSGLGFWALNQFFKFPILNFNTLKPKAILKLFYKTIKRRNV